MFKRRWLVAWRLIRSGNLKELLVRTFRFLKIRLKKKLKVDYSHWRKKWVEINDEDRKQIAIKIDSLPRLPSFTFILNSKKIDNASVHSSVRSITNQLYPNWVLHIDDSELSESDFYDQFFSLDDIRVKLGNPEKHELGDWIVELDSKTQLHEAALFSCAVSLLENPKTKIIYGDHDHINSSGFFCDPHMKPDWNHDLFKSLNYLDPFVAFDKKLFETTQFETSDRHDFLMNAIGHLEEDEILHIPHILSSLEIKNGTGHLQPPTRRIKYELEDPSPKVSILIPTRDQGAMLKRCLRSVYENTDYEDFEIVLVDHDTSEREAIEVIRAFAQKSNFHVLNFSGPFNFSALMNRASEIAKGEILVLLNNDTEIFDPEWLTELASQVLRPEVGVVGALLLFSDETIQHAGVHPGLNGLMGHGHKHLPSDNSGYFSRLKTVHEVAAVTGACLAIEKKTWVDVGGLDEESLPVAYNDIDLCLKVREKNLRIIFSPYAKLFHHESVSRGIDKPVENNKRLQGEIRTMKERWGDSLFHDPAYSPNLSKEGGSFKLSNNPVSLKIF